MDESVFDRLTPEQAARVFDQCETTIGGIRCRFSRGHEGACEPVPGRRAAGIGGGDE